MEFNMELSSIESEKENETEPTFDYGSITKEHKSVVVEIAQILEQYGQTHLADMIKEQFKVVEVPRYKFSDSEMYKSFESAGIYLQIQGWVTKDQIKYPIIGISEDVKKLEEWYKSIKK
jgi:hypothetical protein